MMNKALLTALLLASSSTAMAKPVTYSVGAQVSLNANVNAYTRWGRPAVIDHRRPVVIQQPVAAEPCDTPVVYQPQPLPPQYVWDANTTLGADSSSYVGSVPMARERGSRWVTMTEPTRIDRGREFFSFGSGLGAFRTIQLAEVAGRSHIQQVAIEFSGQSRAQVIHFDGELVANGSPLTIDLQGDARLINRIVVYGSTAQGSAFVIRGM